MNTRDLLAELRQARTALCNRHRADLTEAGIPRELVDRYPLIGVATVRVSSGLYDPCPRGGIAYLTPVLVGNAETPETPAPLVCARHLGECIDLVAWHPAHPERWALRTGAAEWLGCIEPQYMNPEPVQIHQTVLSWLRAECRGLVPLSRTPAELRSVLIHCAHLKAEDKEHAAVLRRALRLPWVAPPVSVSAANG